MNFEWQDAAIVAGVVTAAINGGAFFTFSNLVMPALAELPSADGVAAMQEINRVAPNPLFMTALFGSVAIGIPPTVSALADGAGSPAFYLLTAVVLSLATVGLTAAFHVPRNNALDELQPSASGTAVEWSRYLQTWTRGNHVRAVTSLAGAAAYALALGAR